MQRTLLTFPWHEHAVRPLACKRCELRGATSRSYILLAPAFVPLRYPIRARPRLRSWIAGGSRENSSLPVSDRTECTRAALLIRVTIYSSWPTFLHVPRYLTSVPLSLFLAPLASFSLFTVISTRFPIVLYFTLGE